LPQIQFYERDQFDWVPAIEAKTHSIRAELLPVMEDTTRFSPYVKSGDSKIGQHDEGLADNDDWSALYLWDHSYLVPENAALFPDTLEALEAAPMPDISLQAPMALFSKLAPNTRIPPHNGLLNTRLICHLPLIVPPDCGALRVGNEERPWVEGELLIFDDSIQHEAWNNSDQERVILLFEIWRPEINDEERKMLASMLKAVKEYADRPA
jgi:aspartyl/asparaginyl beta-hydroxylase (cupin superfamily)